MEQIIREYVKTWVASRQDIVLDFIKTTLRCLKHFASLNKAWRSFNVGLQGVALNVVLRKISLRTLGNDCFHNICYCATHNCQTFQSFLINISTNVFKNGPSKICGRQPLKIWSDMVCLSKPYRIKIVKGCPAQIYVTHSWIHCLTLLLAM